MFKYYRILRSRLSTAYHKQSLVEILTNASPDLNLNERVLWLKRFFEWLGTPSQSIRLKLVCRTLSENPYFAKNVSAILKNTLLEVDPIDFFCDAGMISSQGFLKELFLRLALRYLPAHKDFKNLSLLTEEVFEGESDAEWIESLDPKQLQELWNLLQLDSAVISKVSLRTISSLEHACKILAARLASLSSTAEFRNRVPLEDRFLLLDLAEHRSEAILQRSSRVMDNVYQSLEGSGVSIELVFLLERMKGLLARLHLLSSAMAESADLKKSIFTACQILRNQEEKNSILGFLASNLNLISKKIVERAGVTGEHYIARTKSESRELFWSSAGGGLLTVFTTLLKSGISKAGLPLFFEGFMAWINYTLSFMLIQLSHFTLATKTPAMTAPVLAAKLKEAGNTEKQKEFIIEVRNIVRSGVLAVLGNVIFVMIGAVSLDFVWFKITGSHLLSNETGIKYLESHHLFTSLTLWYAVYTGGALWLGSSLGGWFENWFTYRGIPQALEESYFLKVVLGQNRSHRFAKWFSNSIMGIATNVALGFILAFSSIFGKFFGIPIDVRHVTLSAGTISFSIVSLEDFAANGTLIGFSVISILFIGALNFGVSFIISLFVAAQARDIRLSQYPKLFRHWFSMRDRA